MFNSRSICSLLLWVLSSFQLATALTCFGDNSHHTPGHSPNSGNANYLKYGEKLPWPPNSVGTRVVRYCFANEASADALSCLLEDAIGIWSDALGSGPNSGHSLAFRRVQPIIKNMQRVGYHNCFVDGAWNPAVGSDALVVSLDKAGPCATVGYEREEDAVADGRPVSGRHKLLLPPPPLRVSKQQVAHELGHVLGMIHEMCRSDRNNYILFRCTKLEGYDVAFNRAMLDDPISALSNRLCTDKAFADKYGFIGGQYVMNAELGEGSPDTFDDDRFDMQSIMMYPSNTFAGNPACYGNPPNIDECPMVQLDKVGNTIVGTSPIYANPVPSDGDIRFIKRYYPPAGQLAAAGEVQPRHLPRTFSQILADEKSATSFNPAYRGNSVVRVHHVY